MASQYTDAHKVFLQMLQRYRVLNSRQVKKIYENICSHYECNSELHEFVLTINNKLEELHLAIRKIIQEGEKEDMPCYVLINNLNHEAIRQYSSFTKNELAYMKKMMEHIIVSGDGSIEEDFAYHITPTNSLRLGPTAVEILLKKLGEEKWILRENNQISLSALAVGELQSFISENFDNCDKCHFCKSFTLKGRTCRHCNIRSHRACLDNYWKKQKLNACPNRTCKKSWNED